MVINDQLTSWYSSPRPRGGEVGEHVALRRSFQEDGAARAKVLGGVWAGGREEARKVWGQSVQGFLAFEKLLGLLWETQKDTE